MKRKKSRYVYKLSCIRAALIARNRASKQRRLRFGAKVESSRYIMYTFHSEHQRVVTFASGFRGHARFLPWCISSSKLLTHSPFLTLRQLSHILKGLLLRNSCTEINRCSLRSNHAIARETYQFHFTNAIKKIR